MGVKESIEVDKKNWLNSSHTTNSNRVEPQKIPMVKGPEIKIMAAMLRILCPSAQVPLKEEPQAT